MRRDVLDVFGRAAVDHDHPHASEKAWGAVDAEKARLIVGSGTFSGRVRGA